MIIMRTMFGAVACALLLASEATAAVVRVGGRVVVDAPCTKFEYCDTCYGTLAAAVGAIPCRCVIFDLMRC